jgi:ribosomal protein L29
MGVPQFTDIISLSNIELSEAIVELKMNYLIYVLKKSNPSKFKSHEIKHTKRRLAQLKTLLGLRLENPEQKIKLLS